jgi:hypothetical protein
MVVVVVDEVVVTPQPITGVPEHIPFEQESFSVQAS